MGKVTSLQTSAPVPERHAWGQVHFPSSLLTSATERQQRGAGLRFGVPRSLQPPFQVQDISALVVLPEWHVPSHAEIPSPEWTKGPNLIMLLSAAPSLHLCLSSSAVGLSDSCSHSLTPGTGQQQSTTLSRTDRGKHHLVTDPYLSREAGR